MPFLENNHDGFVLPNARFNPTAPPPSCSGLLTPPESPKSGTAPLPMPIPTQYSAASYACHDTPPGFRFGPSEPGPQSAQHDLSRVSETIYTIIEQVIEQKLAEAMGPLRLNIRRFDSENTDLQTQNDTLGSQVRRLEDQVNAQLHTLQNISVASSSNLEIISALATQLSSATNLMQRTHGLNNTQSGPAPFASHQHEHRSSVQPQFCFESRSSRKHRQSRIKSRKPRLVNYMLSKWRTGGARD